MHFVDQGRRFDSSGNYIRRWCPELAKLPGDLIHEPWLAPLSLQRECGCILGSNYPHRISKHPATTVQAQRRIYSLPPPDPEAWIIQPDALNLAQKWQFNCEKAH